MSTAIDVQVRDALPEEREAAIELTIAAYRQYEESFGHPFWEQYMASIRSQREHDEDAQRIVAVHGRKLVAALLLYPPKEVLYERLNATIPYPEIRLLGVHPSVRGKGIATALIRETSDRAARAGFSYLGLHTSELMPSAVRLYIRLGFERAPEYDFPGGDNRPIVEAYRLPLHSPFPW